MMQHQIQTHGRIGSVGLYLGHVWSAFLTFLLSCCQASQITQQPDSGPQVLTGNVPVGLVCDNLRLTTSPLDEAF